MSRLSIRVRLTLAFAAAMAVVLAGVGLFVYQRVADELLASVDQTLLARAGEELGSGRVDSDSGDGTTLAQEYGPLGQLRRSQPRGLPPLVSRPVLAEVLGGRRVWLEKRLPGRRGEWRILALRASSGNGAAVLARSLAPRDESLGHLRHELLIFLPLALLELFMRRPGIALSRTQLLDGAWDIAFESRSNVVDVYVRYLREKIDRPFGRDSIETVRGVGYRLRAEP